MSSKIHGKPSPFPVADASLTTGFNYPVLKYINSKETAMTCRDVIKECENTPDAQFLVKVGDKWCAVLAIKATGDHRNAVAPVICNTSLRGDVVVPPNNEDK